jgi:hypothetical protein
MVEKEIGRLEKGLIFLVLFSLIFLQRFAITIGGFQLSPVFLFSVLSVFILYFFNKIEIDQKRLAIFLCAISGLFIASLYGLITSKQVGVASLLSLVVFYIPFLFINRSKGNLQYVFSTYQNSMMIVAILGIAQFLLQFTGLGYFDPIQSLPAQFVLADYNTQNPLSFGSPIIKANGLFMLEPSFYSKMLATGIVIEFLTKKRLKVMLVFLIGMLLSFSGTGFIILAIAVLPILYKLKPFQFILIAVAIAIPVFFLFEKGYGDIFIKRLAEFNTPNTSAHVRFVAPWLTYKEFFNSEDTGTILFGTGSGTLVDYHGRQYTFDELNTDYITAHPSAYIKLFVEYGLIGGVFFVLFLFYTLLSNRQNKLLTVCLFINYSFLTVSLLQPTTVYFCFILGVFASGIQGLEEKGNKQVKRPDSQDSDYYIRNVYVPRRSSI